MKKKRNQAVSAPAAPAAAGRVRRPSSFVVARRRPPLPLPAANTDVAARSGLG